MLAAQSGCWRCLNAWRCLNPKPPTLRRTTHNVHVLALRERAILKSRRKTWKTMFEHIFTRLIVMCAMCGRVSLDPKAFTALHPLFAGQCRVKTAGGGGCAVGHLPSHISTCPAGGREAML